MRTLYYTRVVNVARDEGHKFTPARYRLEFLFRYRFKNCQISNILSKPDPLKRRTKTLIPFYNFKKQFNFTNICKSYRLSNSNDYKLEGYQTQENIFYYQKI